METFFANLRRSLFLARSGRNLAGVTLGALCVALLTILATPSISAAQSIQTGDMMPIVMGNWTHIIAFVLVGVSYGLLSLALALFYSQTNPPNRVSWIRWLDPAVVSAGEYGTASISSLQLLWFTLIVAFISIENLLGARGLPILSESVLALLGMPAAGKLASIVISSNRLRLSLDNWNWLIDNQFLKEGRTIDPRTTANLKDLILTDGAFDPTRYQLFLFSLVIGIAMILGDNLGEFATGSWNSILFGSNALYLGGKALAPTGIKDLDDRVTAIRESQRDTAAITPITNEDREFIRKSLTSAYGAHAVV
jgi:hypothetical protein